jgi:hypothetical protein
MIEVTRGSYLPRDGKPVRVFYSDVSVKVTGSDTWMDAK